MNLYSKDKIGLFIQLSTSTDVLVMSLAELRAEFQTLAAAFGEIAARRQVLDQEIQLRLKRIAASQRVSALNEAEKDALREVLKP